MDKRIEEICDQLRFDIESALRLMHNLRISQKETIELILGSLEGCKLRLQNLKTSNKS